jgi:NAD(P)-dependent dehydrogenase (short-subunit alcohol dehydrogenase family)
LQSVLEPVPYAVVVNPTRLTMDAGDGIGPQDAVSYAETATVTMRDAGRTGSVVLVTGIDHDGPAAATIAFLDSEMRRLARNMATNGIRVNAVAPGHVAVNRRGNPVSSRVAPLGHSSIHPVEVGKAAWMLVNEDLSGGITGATLTVDRGASLSRVEL